MPNQYSNKPARPVIIPVGPSIAYVELTQGLYSLIDVEDVEQVKRHNWHAAIDIRGRLSGAATNTRISTSKQKILKLHRLITEAPSDMHIDHVNGLPMDNRRCNLRIASHGENMRNRKLPRSNTSGLKGVTRWKNKWKAAIGFEGRRIHLGYYSTVEEAHAAHCEAAIKYHGDFANFG